MLLMWQKKYLMKGIKLMKFKLTKLWKETINQILASGKKELQFLTDPHLKLVQPEDVARAVLYLADEKNNIITGTSINVDNGVYSGL